VVVLGSDVGGKAALVVVVSKDLTDRVRAGDIMKKLAATVGGKGGGRPDMAQGGGPDVAKLDAALKSVEKLVKR
jgi:alanyl-tRNA synthetase